MANTAIFLAEGFEEIEGLMVVDMLRRAGINVDMVSISDSLQVTGSHAITVTAECREQFILENARCYAMN